MSNSEDLIKKALDKLVSDGPFERTALLVVSKDKKHAVVVIARGENVQNGQILTLEDALSPLVMNVSKIRSFISAPDPNSPFTCKAFALAPLDANHNTPVALYADCGQVKCITLDSRRVFRTVVELLNQYLMVSSGDIPNEL